MRPIDEIISSMDTGHSDLQMDSFITEGSGGTKWGCYRQAVMETRSRFYTLRREVLDALILEAEIREVPPVKRDKDSENLKIYKKNLELSEKVEQIQSLIRELSRFYAQADALKTEVDQDCRTTKQLETEYWVKRMQISAGKDIESTGRVSGDTLSTFVLIGKDGIDGLKRVTEGTSGKHLMDLIEPTRIPDLGRSVTTARKMIMKELRLLPGSGKVMRRIEGPVERMAILEPIVPASEPSGHAT